MKKNFLAVVWAAIGGGWLGQAIAERVTDVGVLGWVGIVLGIFGGLLLTASVSRQPLRANPAAVIALSSVIAIGITAVLGRVVWELGGSLLVFAPVVVVAVGVAGGIVQALLAVDHRITCGMGWIGVLAAAALIPGALEVEAVVAVVLLGLAGPVGAHVAWRRAGGGGRGMSAAWT
jgi:hypothetical protein